MEKLTAKIYEEYIQRKLIKRMQGKNTNRKHELLTKRHKEGAKWKDTIAERNTVQQETTHQNFFTCFLLNWINNFNGNNIKGFQRKYVLVFVVCFECSTLKIRVLLIRQYQSEHLKCTNLRLHRFQLIAYRANQRIQYFSTEPSFIFIYFFSISTRQFQQLYCNKLHVSRIFEPFPTLLLLQFLFFIQIRNIAQFITYILSMLPLPYLCSVKYHSVTQLSW